MLYIEGQVEIPGPHFVYIMTINYYIAAYQSLIHPQDIFIYPTRISASSNNFAYLASDYENTLYTLNRFHNEKRFLIKLTTAQIMDWKLMSLPWWHYEKKINNKEKPWDKLDIVERL